MATFVLARRVEVSDGNYRVDAVRLDCRRSGEVGDAWQRSGRHSRQFAHRNCRRHKSEATSDEC